MVVAQHIRRLANGVSRYEPAAIYKFVHADQARENRETFSHTTQLTQMYHQFTSYHLGTNRAVFFMLPQPHIIQAKNTFVNGPRLLEGVQEIFLVVFRPQAVNEICVEAYLETGHIVNKPIYDNDPYERKPIPKALEIHIHEEAHEVDVEDKADDSQKQPHQANTTFNPSEDVGPGWEVDTENQGGYHVDLYKVPSGYNPDYKITPETNIVNAWAKISAYFRDDWPDDNEYIAGVLNLSATVFVRKMKANTVTGYSKSLWITGRGVCCCPNVKRPQFERPSVTYEVPLLVSTAPQSGVAVGAKPSDNNAPKRATTTKKGRTEISNPSDSQDFDQCELENLIV